MIVSEGELRVSYLSCKWYKWLSVIAELPLNMMTVSGGHYNNDT